MSGWAEDVFHVLVSAAVRQAAYVPDMGLNTLIELCHPDQRILPVPLTIADAGS